MLWSSEERSRRAIAGAASINTEKRLPEHVFTRLPTHTLFFDGDVLFDSSCWQLIADLAIVHGEAAVHYLVAEPGPQHFATNVGSAGGFTLSVDSTEDELRKCLGVDGDEPENGWIGYVAEAVAIFGDSGDWGIWGERNIAGLVTARESEAFQRWLLKHGPFLPPEDALAGFMGFNTGYDQEWSNRIHENYSSINGLSQTP